MKMHFVTKTGTIFFLQYDKWSDWCTFRLSYLLCRSHFTESQNHPLLFHFLHLSPISTYDFMQDFLAQNGAKRVQKLAKNVNKPSLFQNVSLEFWAWLSANADLWTGYLQFVKDWCIIYFLHTRIFCTRH